MLSSSVMFWHVKVKCKVLQSDVIMKLLRLKNHQSKLNLNLLTHRYWSNVDIYINTPHSAILHFNPYSLYPYRKTCILHMYTKSQVNWTYGSRQYFFRLSEIFTVQPNPSWRTLWVLESFSFPMRNEVHTLWLCLLPHTQWSTLQCSALTFAVHLVAE